MNTIVKALRFLKTKLLIITSITVSGCAVVSPLEISDIKNVTDLSERMAKSYTPGLMKVMTYAGINTSKIENDDFRAISFKVKGEIDESDNISITFGKYCSKIGGDFNNDNSATLQGVKTLTCARKNELAQFNVIISGKSYNGSNSLNCYSILVIEDKLIGMSAPLYSDRLSWLSTTNVGEKFNSNYGC